MDDLFIMSRRKIRPASLQEIEKVPERRIKLVDRNGKILMRSVRKDVLMLKLFGENGGGRKRRRKKRK